MFEKIITKRFRRNTIMFFYNISYFNLGVVDNDDLVITEILLKMALNIIKQTNKQTLNQ
jgi:hypothetical protein